MIIQQSDLLKGLSRDFVKEFMDTSTKESLEEGDLLFREGDKASHFYILLKGRVRLNIGGAGQMVYHVDRPGEAFGWSSLVDREAYSASAQCMVPTKLLIVGREEFQRIVEKDPRSGMIFYKRLAETVGERLINSFDDFIVFRKSILITTYVLLHRFSSACHHIHIEQGLKPIHDTGDPPSFPKILHIPIASGVYFCNGRRIFAKCIKSIQNVDIFFCFI